MQCFMTIININDSTFLIGKGQEQELFKLQRFARVPNEYMSHCSRWQECNS